MAPRTKRAAGFEDGEAQNKKPRVSNSDGRVGASEIQEINLDNEENNLGEDQAIMIPEIGDCKGLDEKVAQADKLARSHHDNANKMKKEVKDDSEFLMNMVAQQKSKIELGRKAFEDSIWPLLTAALAPLSALDTVSSKSSSVSIAQTTGETTELYQDCLSILVESRKLMELLGIESTRKLPPSRVPDARAELERDKNAALDSIHAGKKLATRHIQQRLAGHNLGGIVRQSILEEEERKGMLLMKWGAGSADNCIERDSAFGEITTGLVKAVSKFEKLVRHE